MKERLSMALQLNRQGDNNWIRHIESIVSARNKETIRGTSIVRNSVTKHNFMKVLEELYNSTDPTMLFNLASTSSDAYAPWLAKKIWKHDLGAKVLLSRDANYQLKKDFFRKKSILGAYDEKVYTVKSRELKGNKFFLTPVYTLSPTRGDSKYYESELIPAYFAL